MLVAVAACALFAPAVAFADTAHLTDGSRINGHVISLSADELRFKTGFSDSLAIPREQLAGLASDEALPTELTSGEVIRVRFEYTADTQTQSMMPTGSGDTALGSDGLAGVAAIDPRVVAAQQDDGQFVLPDADSLPPNNGDYWSGRFEFALNGKSGNSQTSSILTEVSGLRDTGDTRLSLSGSVDREEENQRQTVEEYIGKARFEDDITERVFWFAQQRLEKDGFENIDLRSRTLVGPGLFVFRRDRLTFKLSSGVGYKHEEYTDGDSEGEIIVSAGWDYAQLVGEWLKLTHEFTAYPEIANNPSKNFILESALGVEVPIAGSDVWRLRGALNHDYNNHPEPDVQPLDTSYQVGIIREF
jgi:putative salt-induced outer membrane protein YdiY